MSLSEHEQQALREIERSLLQDDPKFGSSVAEDSGFGGDGGAITLRGIALIVVGLLLLVGGVALAQQNLWFVSISIVGFLVMFTSGVWMLRGRKEKAPSYSGVRAKQKSVGGQGGVSGRLEENFRRRFEER